MGKASEQTNLLNSFFKILNVDETKAIQTLMITDELFRAKDLKKREKYVKIVENCKDNGADIQIFSSLHVSGEQLKQITGIAAILRFPLPEILEIDMDQTEDDEESETESDDEDDDEQKND